MNHIVRFGTGCGIEIRGDDLRVVVLKSRPAGVTVLGRTVLSGFRERPPHEWGAEYEAFLKRLGLSHLAATVCLPRGDVIVRQIHLPPVGPKELASAVSYQLEALHPFGEDEVYHVYAPLKGGAEGGGQLAVAVVIAERAKVDAYADRFEAAGIMVKAFTVAASAFYSGIRVRWDSPPAPFVIADFHDHKLEIYGEGKGRPVFSAEFDLRSLGTDRALHLAGADLRLQENEQASLAVCGEIADESAPAWVRGEEQPAPNGSGSFESRPPAELLPSPVSAPAEFEIGRDATAMAVALEAACPRAGWRANLLPSHRRQSSSRWMYVPTAALLAALFLLGAAFSLRATIQDRGYVKALEAELAKLGAAVAEVEETRKKSAQAKQRVDLLRSLQGRTEADLRILSELSVLIPDTVWLNTFEINDQGVQMSGEAQSAAPLLGILNESRLLTNAAFSTSLVKIENGERFQIVAERRETPEAPREETVAAAASARPQAPPAPEPPSTLMTIESEGTAAAQEAP